MAEVSKDRGRVAYRMNKDRLFKKYGVHNVGGCAFGWVRVRIKGKWFFINPKNDAKQNSDGFDHASSFEKHSEGIRAVVQRGDEYFHLFLDGRLEPFFQKSA